MPDAAAKSPKCRDGGGNLWILSGFNRSNRVFAAPCALNGKDHLL